MDELTVLPVIPWVGAVVLLVLLVAFNVPAPAAPRRARLRAAGSALANRVAAVAALAVTVLVLVVTRAGPASELDNPVSALVVGLGWPLLFVLPAAVSPLLGRSADDARPAGDEQVESDGRPRDVRPAVAGALAAVGYLVLVPQATSPATIGTALVGYAVIMLAVGVALNRAAVGRVEVLGLLARWCALGPRLIRWHPPRGAAAVTAVVLGGAWAERTVRSADWAEAGYGTAGETLLLAGAVAAAGAAALALTRWSDGHAAPVLLPLAGAAVVAGVLRRALISVQLLWDQSGLGDLGVQPDPLGVAGGQALALAVVATGGLLAAVVLARRVGPGAARLPGTAVVTLLTAISGAVVLAP